MMMYKRIFFLAILLIFIFWGCNSRKISLLKSRESFTEFNEKFHQDSKFQISRVDFPIKGYFTDGDNKKEWTKENWIMHKTPVGETEMGEYKVEVIREEDLVIEKIWIEASEFYHERRFKLIKGKWYLVYFKDMN